MVKGKEYRKDSHDTAVIRAHYRVDKPSGFHTEGGGGPGIPPPEISQLSKVIIVLSQVLHNNLVPDCVRSNLRGSKFKGWGGGGGGGGACPQTPPSEHSRLSCYHPVPPPTQNHV